jgi:putative aldouronate transport system substrate-binding protein
VTIRGYRCSIIILAIVLTMITGCSDMSGLNKRGNEEVSSQHIETTTASEAVTTLTIELFDRNNTPAGAPPITDNFMTQYIQKNFGDPNHIDVEFVTVPRSQEVERLNVLMAANQAPDIVFTYNEPAVSNLANQGKLTNLSSLLEQYGQDLKEVLGDEVLSAGVFNGEQFAIPAKRVLTAHSTTFIREDWLQEVGLAIPETTEQFYNALKAFKEKKPGKYGDDIVPYGLIDYFHTTPLQYSFWDWDLITEEDLYANPRWMMPGNKEAFRFLNKLYHEGLIDPNFALQMDKDTQQFQKDLISGRIGAATANTNEPVYMGYLGELEKNDPDAILTPIDPFTSASGKKTKPLLTKHGMYIMIPKNSKNAEAAMKYLNWMSQPENFITLQNGIEGKTYKIEEGLPITLENESTKIVMYNYFDYCIILNGKFVSNTDELLNIKANASDPKYEEFTVNSIEYGMNDGIVTPRVDATILSEIKYSTILNEKKDEIFVKVITALPEEFDAVYDKEVEEYLRIGGQQVIEEKRKAFRDRQE